MKFDLFYCRESKSTGVRFDLTCLTTRETPISITRCQLLAFLRYRILSVQHLIGLYLNVCAIGYRSELMLDSDHKFCTMKQRFVERDLPNLASNATSNWRLIYILILMYFM